MMTATEILESAAEGDVIYWSVNYATKVCQRHGLDLQDYMVERWSDAATRVPAGDLLGWMGY